MITRRALLTSTLAGASLAGVGLPAAAAAEAAGRPTNLFLDNNYHDGFYLMPVEPSETPRQILDFGRPGRTPNWQLDEWFTRHSIADTPWRRYPVGSVRGLWTAGRGYENQAKRVIVGHNGQLWLQAMASAEYERPRQSGESWPHLLIEQRWMFDGPKLADLRRAHLDLRVRIDHIINQMDPADYNPDLHAAQITAFLTLQNLNRDSADFGSLVWFGIPVVDSRHDIAPGHFAEDSGHTGQTNQFIATIPGTEFWRHSIKDGRWHTARTDLLPHMRHAFEVAQERGYLPATRWTDLQISTSNLGWELPGTFDVAVELAPLTVRLVR